MNIRNRIHAGTAKGPGIVFLLVLLAVLLKIFRALRCLRIGIHTADYASRVQKHPGLQGNQTTFSHTLQPVNRHGNLLVWVPNTPATPQF